MITVHVPATSANVGSGFDAVGLALSLGNTVVMEEADGCHIASLDQQVLPLGEDNLVFSSAKLLYAHCGQTFKGLTLRQNSPIPIARGMGSSSACIVAGLIGANALLKNPCTREELLTIAADIEGHPDNVAPALMGGLVASCMQDKKVYSVKKEISPIISFGLFVPNFELLTTKARAALPKNIKHSDAIFNVSRAPLLQAALCEGRLDLLEVATGDKLHQQYRLPLIKGGEEIFSLAFNAGAQAVCISGAGPAIMAIVAGGAEHKFWQNAENELLEAKYKGKDIGAFKLLHLRADNLGARLI